MNIKYVSNRSQFIDLDAARPRFMNLETAANLLAECGVLRPEVELAKIMAEPIFMEKPPNRPAHYAHIANYNIEYSKNLWTVQGVKCGLQDATDLLLKRGIGLQDALRSLALAVDLSTKNR